MFAINSANASIIPPSTETIDVGTHAGTYTGNTRGFWFTAPVDFWITGIDVPTDASTANFSTSILRLPTAPSFYSATTNLFDILFEERNQASAITGLAIKINIGDVIGVLGSRGNANSYGSSPFMTSIFGNAVTLTRFGTQNVIGNSTTVAGMQVWQESRGSISRLNLTVSNTNPVTASVPTPATLPILFLGICGLLIVRRNKKHR